MRYTVLDEEMGRKIDINTLQRGMTVGDFMLEVRNKFKLSENFELHYGNVRLASKQILECLEINTRSTPIRIVRIFAARDPFSILLDDTLLQEYCQTKSFLTPIDKFKRTESAGKLHSIGQRSCSTLNGRYSKLDDIERASSSCPSEHSSAINHLRSKQSVQIHQRQTKTESSLPQNAAPEIYSTSDFDSDSGSESVSNCEKEAVQRWSKSSVAHRRFSKSEPLLNVTHNDNTDSYENDFTEESEEFEYTSASTKPSFSLAQSDSCCEIPQYSRKLTVRIRTFYETYFLNIPNDTTMKNLVRLCWDNIPFENESYRMEEHILLLFNHRLHIFLENCQNELVKDFLKLTPKNATVDFYTYALNKEYDGFMYTFDTGYNNLFKTSDSWNPVNFFEYRQMQRPQSILLSSLYALALYFKCDNPQVAGIRHAMKAQFFIQLRKCMYPPAVLAFKHAIDGSMFWFEKALLMDAISQLLSHLYPSTLHKAQVMRSDCFDLVPFLFCWLLEKCDPNEEEVDRFSLVTLVDTHTIDSSYFKDPITTNHANRRNLKLEDFDSVQNQLGLIRHVDIRSLIQYLISIREHSSTDTHLIKEYEIYDPDTEVSSELKSISRWNEEAIKNNYQTMNRKYPSFIIMTREALTNKINNQLVFLNDGHTVSLLLSKEHINGEKNNRKDGINHLFRMFNPLDTSQDIVMSRGDALAQREKLLSDPRLPMYFSETVVTEPKPASFADTNMNRPAEQVTVVLLDMSRSMFDHYVGMNDRIGSCKHIDMCTAMLGTLSDNMLPKDEAHAFGLIEFGDTVRVTCPITRNRGKFEESLKSHSQMGNRTCMYDAIEEAMRRIKTYTDSPLRATNNCGKLIICLSDGMNNAGSTSISILEERIRRVTIVIDSVSFLHQNQIEDNEKKRTIANFRDLCWRSGGFVYSKLFSRSNIEIAAMFEQEAAVWLSKRDRKSSGFVEKPERYINPIFEQPATHQILNNKSTGGSNCANHILKEFNTMQIHKSNEVQAFAVQKDISFWKVILKGPEQTPYENRYWVLYVEFRSTYPSSPPIVRFMTPIYHVNISGDGKICHQIFDQSWSSKTKMTTIFKNILDLLRHPNFTDAVSMEKAHLFRDDPPEYEQQARTHANINAYGDVETLKRQHQIDDEETLNEFRQS